MKEFFMFCFRENISCESVFPKTSMLCGIRPVFKSDTRTYSFIAAGDNENGNWPDAPGNAVDKNKIEP
ncbi:MAG TPA: hypothetical protein VIH22_18740 [Cyclobacteriaceae bacterium]